MINNIKSKFDIKDSMKKKILKLKKRLILVLIN